MPSPLPALTALSLFFLFAAAHSFSTFDETWLDLNFKPALFTALPWVFLPGDVMVSRSLLENIIPQRVNGMSFEAICKNRNKILANE